MSREAESSSPTISTNSPAKAVSFQRQSVSSSKFINLSARWLIGLRHGLNPSRLGV